MAPTLWLGTLAWDLAYDALVAVLGAAGVSLSIPASNDDLVWH